MYSCKLVYVLLRLLNHHDEVQLSSLHQILFHLSHITACTAKAQARAGTWMSCGVGIPKIFWTGPHQNVPVWSQAHWPRLQGQEPFGFGGMRLGLGLGQWVSGGLKLGRDGYTRSACPGQSGRN